MMSTGRYNYYEILEVTSNAGPDEVTTAYQRARDTYRGDNPAIYTIFSEQEARELLTLIEEAYAVLGNKSLRTLYDQRLFSRVQSNEDLTYASLLEASQTCKHSHHAEADKSTFEMDPEFEKVISETNEWTGALLKKVREYKNVALERLSSKTKINPFYLNAIEEMDPSGLPATVFVRGYVVQMAKFLGLNERKVADSYMTQYKKINSSK